VSSNVTSPSTRDGPLEEDEVGAVGALGPRLSPEANESVSLRHALGSDVGATGLNHKAAKVGLIVHVVDHQREGVAPDAVAAVLVSQ
jgi:hypothetical protein